MIYVPSAGEMARYSTTGKLIYHLLEKWHAILPRVNLYTVCWRNGTLFYHDTVIYHHAKALVTDSTLLVGLLIALVFVVTKV